jgi:dUTP pyrophosphatase
MGTPVGASNEIKIYLKTKTYISYNQEEIKIEPVKPIKMSDGAAAYDIAYCGIETNLWPQQTMVLDTGVYLELPPNVCAMILSRSGLAAKNSIFCLNAPGLIDPDYRGEIKVILHNLSDKPFRIHNGMRIAQIMFFHIDNFKITYHEYTQEIENQTTRGNNGIGSTGV